MYVCMYKNSRQFTSSTKQKKTHACLCTQFFQYLEKNFSLRLNSAETKHGVYPSLSFLLNQLKHLAYKSIAKINKM